MKVTSRFDRRKKTKFNDMCEENSCIIWIVAIFDGKLPKYIEKNTPKKWIKKLEDAEDFICESIVEEIKKEYEDKDVSVIICEYEFNWVDDPKKFIQDQIFGQNIACWLTKNDSHKKLIHACSWNKID